MGDIAVTDTPLSSNLVDRLLTPITMPRPSGGDDSGAFELCLGEAKIRREAAAEIKRLRAALERVAFGPYDTGDDPLTFARKALAEQPAETKESR